MKSPWSEEMSFNRIVGIRAKAHKAARRAATRKALRESLKRFLQGVLVVEQPRALLDRMGRTFPAPWIRLSSLFAAPSEAYFCRNLASPAAEVLEEGSRASPPAGTDIAHLIPLSQSALWDKDGEACRLTGVQVRNPAAWAQHCAGAHFRREQKRLLDAKNRLGLAEMRLQQALSFYAGEYLPLEYEELTEDALARFARDLALPGTVDWGGFFRSCRKRRTRYPSEPDTFEPWVVATTKVALFLKATAAPAAYPDLEPLQAYYAVLLEHVVRRARFRRDSRLMQHVRDRTLAISFRRCIWPLRCLYLQYAGRGSLPPSEVGEITAQGADKFNGGVEGGGDASGPRGSVHSVTLGRDDAFALAADFGMVPDRMPPALFSALVDTVLRSHAMPEPLTRLTKSVRGKSALGERLGFAAFVELLARSAMFCCPPQDQTTREQAIEELASSFSSPVVGERDRREAAPVQRRLWSRRGDKQPLHERLPAYCVPLPEDAAPRREVGAPLERVGGEAAASGRTGGPHQTAPAAGPVSSSDKRRGGTGWDMQTNFPSRFEGDLRRPVLGLTRSLPALPLARDGTAMPGGGGEREAFEAKLAAAFDGWGGEASRRSRRDAGATRREGGARRPRADRGASAGGEMAFGARVVATGGAGAHVSEWDFSTEPAASMAIKAHYEGSLARATSMMVSGNRAQRESMLTRLGGRATGRLVLQWRSGQRMDGSFAQLPAPAAPSAPHPFQDKYLEAKRRSGPELDYGDWEREHLPRSRLPSRRSVLSDQAQSAYSLRREDLRGRAPQAPGTAEGPPSAAATTDRSVPPLGDAELLECRNAELATGMDSTLRRMASEAPVVATGSK